MSGTNDEGYLIALQKSFSGNRYEKHQSPVKSALSKIRSEVSYSFFRSAFIALLRQLSALRPTWEGLHIFAMDGWQVDIPRTKNLLKNKFRGKSIWGHFETYRLKMYLTHCYDVLSGTSHSLTLSELLNEPKDARSLVEKLPRNSLTLYDRLYISEKMMLTHIKRKNYFLMRLRSEGVSFWIKDFLESHHTESTYKFHGQILRMIKIKNPRTGEFDAFITNLPNRLCNKKTISSLYTLRWEVENSFRELSQTIKLEQWHSKSLNGILQEIFATLWLINFTKAEMLKRTAFPPDPLSRIYKKPNFKFILSFVIQNLPRIFQRIRGVLSPMRKLMNLSTEKRKRRSRHYDRIVKRPNPPFPFKNIALSATGEFLK